jgi:hypothetical protein
MQSLSARQEYRNSAHCAYRIFTEEGVLKFWKGTTPRLARLVVRIRARGMYVPSLWTDERWYHLLGVRGNLPARRSVRLEQEMHRCRFKR